MQGSVIQLPNCLMVINHYADKNQLLLLSCPCKRLGGCYYRRSSMDKVHSFLSMENIMLIFFPVFVFFPPYVQVF